MKTGKQKEAPQNEQVNPEQPKTPDPPKLEEVIGSPEWAAKIREEARSLSGYIDRNYMRLAEIIFLVSETTKENRPGEKRIYDVWGYDSAGSWASAELGLQKRKAEFLCKIYYTLHRVLDITQEERDRIVKLGYSKVRTIVSVLTQASWEKWVTLAEQCSINDLVDLVQEHRAELKKGKSDDDIPELGETVTIKFKLLSDQHEVVRTALDLAAKLMSSDHDSKNLTLICNDFLATAGGAGRGPTKGTETAEEKEKRHRVILDYLANLERLLGVRLAAIDPTTNPHELLYGVRALDEFTDSNKAFMAANTKEPSKEESEGEDGEDGEDGEEG